MNFGLHYQNGQLICIVQILQYGQLICIIENLFLYQADLSNLNHLRNVIAKFQIRQILI